MAGCIHLQHIDMAAFGDLLAGLTRTAWLQRGLAGSIRANAIQPTGQNTGSRGLANPTHAGQHKGMRQPAHRERVAERAHQRFLTHHGGKAGGPVFAGQHPIGCIACLTHLTALAIWVCAMHRLIAFLAWFAQSDLASPVLKVAHWQQDRA